LTNDYQSKMIKKEEYSAVQRLKTRAGRDIDCKGSYFKLKNVQNIFLGCSLFYMIFISKLDSV